MIPPILPIALTTFREAIRAKLTAIIGAFACFCLGLSVVAASLTLGWPIRIVADIALSGMNLAVVAIAISLGISSTSREIERRTAFYLLARPIPRWSLLLGKAIGIGGATSAVLLPLTALVAGLLAAFSHEGGIFYPVTSYLAAVALIWLRAMVLGAIAVAAASCMAPTVSAILTTTVAIGSYLTAEARLLLRQTSGTAWIGEVVYYLLPDFAALDGLANLIHGQPIWTPLTTVAAVQAVLYTAFVLFVGCVAFSRRELG